MKSAIEKNFNVLKSKKFLIFFLLAFFLITSMAVAYTGEYYGIWEDYKNFGVIAGFNYLFSLLGKPVSNLTSLFSFRVIVLTLFIDNFWIWK